MSTAGGTSAPLGSGNSDGNDSGDGDDRRPPGRRRRWPLVAGAAALVVVLIGLWVVYGGERARPSSEDDARQRLAEAAGGTPPAGTAPPTGTGSVLAAPPVPGLYRYEGGGRETTSTPPVSEELGPAMPATVVPTAEDGCWLMRIDYNSHHWDSTTYCTGDGRLVERGGATFTRRVLGTFTIDNTSTFTCDPNPLWERGDAPGTKRPRSCSGSGDTMPDPTAVRGTVAVVGPEQLDVGGERVATMHLRYDNVVSQAQNGTETTDQWFAIDTGLPVRNERRVSLTSSSPIGDIEYLEEGWHRLTSPRPV